MKFKLIYEDTYKVHPDVFSLLSAGGGGMTPDMIFHMIITYQMIRYFATLIYCKNIIVITEREISNKPLFFPLNISFIWGGIASTVVATAGEILTRNICYIGDTTLGHDFMNSSTVSSHIILPLKYRDV